MDDLREVIARAIGPCLDRAHNEDQLADAALAAIKVAGFVVVPAEPTAEMLVAGAKDFKGDLVTTRGASAIYRAMIEASNAPT